MPNALERIQGPIFDLLDFIAGKTDFITVVLSFFSVAVVILLVFPVHECAHGFMAKWLGDDTAEREGRLTLNPFDHVDPMGALFMCITCIGWAKPVPVNVRRCTKVKGRTALALTALAGPVSNLLMAYIVMIIMKLLYCFMPYSNTLAIVCVGLSYVIGISIYLAVFNLLPIPPFDGYKIAASFLPYKVVNFMDNYAQYINWGFFLLLILGVFDKPLNFISDWIYVLLYYASAFIPLG